MSAKTSGSGKPSEGVSEPHGDQGAGDRDETATPNAHEELQQLAGRLRRAVLAVAWRQWRVIGAGAVNRPSARPGTRAGEETRRHLHAIVDPEALVLISLVLLDHERRLGDLLHDWGARNSDLLSVQRMKNLEADYPEPVRGPLTYRLAWFAAVARDEGKDLRWRSLAQGWPGAPGRRPEKSDQGRIEAHPGGDAHERAYGTHAPPNAPAKSRATRARLIASATLMLRLRLGIGVGVKADLIAFLLARVEDWATVRDITDATGYTVAAVRRAAEDLAAARLIESFDGQPTGYRATYEAWAPLMGFRDRPPRWASWHERFHFATAFLHWAEVARERPLSAYAFGAQGRHLLERYRPAFERDHVTVWSTHSPVADWGAFISRAVKSLASWMEEMA